MAAHRRIVTALATLVLITTGTVPPARAEAALATQVVTLAASDDIVGNPERGFYRYSETRLSGDPSTYQRLDPVKLANERKAEGITLIFRYFYLDGYRDRDDLAPVDLDLLRGDLSAARAAGVKLVIRFAYSSSSSADAPPARVTGHIRQLAPVLNENAGVIQALQAGFIGRWGEWYYTDNFVSDPARPWLLSDADWAAREQVLRTLLESTTASIRIQVRYPAVKQRVEHSLRPAQAARIGVHNDCFLAGTDDHGTFPRTGDRDWLATQSSSSLTGGETCELNRPRTDWSNASTELSRYHFTYLNADFHQSVLDSWSAGRAEAARRLGYRIHVSRTTTPISAIAGRRATVRITLTNTGYAAPTANRPVQLILSGAVTKVVKVTTDTRTWAPGRTVTLSASFVLPTPKGTYRLHLNMPDPVADLATQAPLINGESTNAAYAIRLANVGVWRPRTGWNDLNTALSVAAP
ncbi:DUF4832 domain-containing protein [Actinoplanes utahensis]|uniref:DUF4832 domain-containing protein n=1 Tax=Actinoplanes utahensis TaxID=1869 RepID=UPI00068F68DE|nr:DUF4832 domain-containing protein [Actinoplanes utahensis]GIF33333.1 hypothetical protein Aut01nite_63190 [Actinoplanes utahensis]